MPRIAMLFLLLLVVPTSARSAPGHDVRRGHGSSTCARVMDSTERGRIVPAGSEALRAPCAVTLLQGVPCPRLCAAVGSGVARCLGVRDRFAVPRSLLV